MSAKTYNRLNTEAVERIHQVTASYNKSSDYLEHARSAHVSSRINSTPDSVSRVKTGSSGNGALSGVNTALRMAAKTLNESGDPGAAMIGTTITAAQTAVYGTKAAIKTGKTIYKVGKGAYQVGLTGVKATVTVAKTASDVVRGRAVMTGGVVKNMQIHAAETGLGQTMLSKKIVHSVNRIRTTVKAGPKSIAKGMGRGFGRGAKAIGKGAVKKGIPAINTMANRSQDETIRGYGKIMTGARTGVNTAVKSVKGTKRAVRTSVRATKAVVRGTRVATRTVVMAGRSVAAAAGQAIGAMMSTPVGWIILLVIVIIAVIVILFTLFAGGSAASGSFDEKDDDTDEISYYETEDYLAEVIPGISEDYKKKLLKAIEKYEKNYDVVRLYSNSGSTEVVEATADGIDYIMPTDAEIVNTLSPLYSAVIYTYDFELTKRQAKKLAEDLFDSMFTYESEPTVTYEICGQDLATGEGDPVDACEACSAAAGETVYHALDDCPNYSTVTHTSYTCDECDDEGTSVAKAGSLACGKTEHEHSKAAGCYSYKYVNGSFQWVLTCTQTEHTHTAWKSEDSPGCYSTVYEDGFTCSGCRHCDGHSVASFTVSDAGIYTVAYNYFQTKIDEILAIAEEDRTQEQKDELMNCEDGYELFEELMSEYVDGYSSSFSIEDLGDVDWHVSADRTGNEAVVDKALSQVGNKGGKIYWTYCGFESRVAWCACFVHWCMCETPSASGSWPRTSNNAYCQTVADYFKSAGQWGSRGYTDLVPGDVIYFDWDGDGHTDHTGIVIGTDGKLVYTVEGNSGDAVKCKTYSINSGSIYGYGLMKY